MKEQILAAMDMLGQALEEINTGVEVATPTPLTKEEISLNIAGHKDFHIENGVLFEQMAPYYNPEKAPFDGNSWLLTSTQYTNGARYDNGYLRDGRPYKTENRDGVVYRKMPQQIVGPDYYWIGKGISDVTAPEWNAAEVDHSANFQQKLENIRNYKGGLRNSLASWPDREREAYQSTH
jgi:hypothetical protein